MLVSVITAVGGELRRSTDVEARGGMQESTCLPCFWLLLEVLEPPGANVEGVSACT
jgi:hypothetical protein